MFGCMMRSIGWDMSSTHLKSGWLCSSFASLPSELRQFRLKGQVLLGLGLNLLLPTKPQQSERICQTSECARYMQRKWYLYFLHIQQYFSFFYYVHVHFNSILFILQFRFLPLEPHPKHVKAWPSSTNIIGCKF